MSVKKLMLLATSAVAVVAFAIPASASAGPGGFMHDGGPIVGEPSGSFSGFIGFGTGLGTFGCEAHAEITLTTSDAHVTDLEITTGACEGTGALAGCELEEHELTGMPWTATPIGGSSITLDDVEIHNLFEECPLSEIAITFEEVSLEVDDPEAIASVEISGEGVIDTLGQELEAFAFGEMDVVGTDAGTYELG